MSNNKDLAKEALNGNVSVVIDNEFVSSFDSSSVLVRSIWNKCSIPPSVKNWKHNNYTIDYLGYVPIDKMINRMLADGERLEAYRQTPEYKALYEQSIREDETRPLDDDLIYCDRLTLLDTARSLQYQLEEYRQNKKIDTEKEISSPVDQTRGGQGGADGVNPDNVDVVGE